MQLRESDAGAIAASLASLWTRRLRELTMVKPVQLRESGADAGAGASAASPTNQRTMQSLLKPTVLLW